MYYIHIMYVLYYIHDFDCHFQNRNSEFCAPLTSFDWNETDPNIVGTSSIDTTCTIWGLEVHNQIITTPSSFFRLSLSLSQTAQVLGKVTGSVRTQLIAHDKEVCVCVCGWA